MKNLNFFPMKVFKVAFVFLTKRFKDFGDRFEGGFRN